MKLLILPLLCLWITASTSGQSPEVFIEINERDLIPEGITYDDVSKRFFIGSIYKRKIIQISQTGRVTDFIAMAQDSIGGVLGMKVDNRRQRLYSISNTSEGKENQPMVHVYSLTGKLITKFKGPVGNNVFFNDLVLTPTGDAYITDSGSGSIFYVGSDLAKIELFMNAKELTDANGIEYFTQGKALIVSTNIGFVRIDTATKLIKPVPYSYYFINGIDGLSLHKNSLIGIQNITYPFTITQYTLSESQDSIINARVLGIDIPWFDIPTTGTIVDNHYYFIANSQLDNYHEGKLIDEEKLKTTKIGKIKLD